MALAQKNRRIDLRIENSQKNLLVYAASVRHKKLSAFVLDSALKEAEELIAEKAHFQLPQAQWKAFCIALDSPAREIPKLKKLFQKQNILNA